VPRTDEVARAVFLDRDGTIIHDSGYPREASSVALVPGASTALARLRAAGFRLVLVSNQSGVGRGLISPQELDEVHARVLELLGASGVELDGAYYCVHAPWDGCACRKPSPTLLLEAAEELGLDLPKSFMVGDSASDVKAGEAAGCQAILLGSEPAATELPGHNGTRVAASWPEVVELILRGRDG
jgi:histidinol-phosphate phosphatase family protein